MKTVNLLPDWYLQHQRQNRNLRLHIAIMALLAAGMIAAHVAARGQIDALTVTEQSVATRLNAVGDPSAALTIQKTELKRLENLQLAYRELGNTIPMSAVLQQIQNDMTIGMALSRVMIDVRGEPVRGSGLVGDQKNPPRIHNVAHLVVVGVAPNDVQIAQLIGKISSNPLFSDVSLNYTHTELLNDHSIRRFEIQMQMELDRLATEDPMSGKPSPVQVSMTGGGPNAG